MLIRLSYNIIPPFKIQPKNPEYLLNCYLDKELFRRHRNILLHEENLNDYYLVLSNRSDHLLCRTEYAYTMWWMNNQQGLLFPRCFFEDFEEFYKLISCNFLNDSSEYNRWKIVEGKFNLPFGGMEFHMIIQ